MTKKSISSALEVDPHLGLLFKLRLLEDEYQVSQNSEKDEMLFSKIVAIEKEISEIPVSTLEGLVAKLVWAVNSDDFQEIADTEAGRVICECARAVSA